MLTGVRRSIGACLRWDELGGDWAAMPASRMKGGRDFRAAKPSTARAIMAELLGEPVHEWRIHDLRRTLASGLAALGYRAEIIKRVLGHAAKSNDVTEAHYNWHSYDNEALAAVQSWAAFVEKLPSVLIKTDMAA